MHKAELHLDQFENHIRSRRHGLFGAAAGGHLRGLDGGDGRCSGCARRRFAAAA